MPTAPTSSSACPTAPTTWASTTATVPAGYTQTGYGDPGTPCGACTSQSPAIPISGGNTVPTVDFGYRPPLTGVYPVSGRVWNDVDGGGTQERRRTRHPRREGLPVRQRRHDGDRLHDDTGQRRLHLPGRHAPAPT